MQRSNDTVDVTMFITVESYFKTILKHIWTSLVAQKVKNLPATLQTQVRSLCLEDPLEKETAINSSILAWEIPWIEERGRLQSIGSQKSQTLLSD